MLCEVGQHEPWFDRLRCVSWAPQVDLCLRFPVELTPRSFPRHMFQGCRRCTDQAKYGRNQRSLADSGSNVGELGMRSKVAVVGPTFDQLSDEAGPEFGQVWPAFGQDCAEFGRCRPGMSLSLTTESASSRPTSIASCRAHAIRRVSPEFDSESTK